jgi:hypothetical protein
MTPPVPDPHPGGSHWEGPGQFPRPEPSPTGTRRRLQALAARSWSPEALESQMGIPAHLISRELDGYDELAPELAADVAVAYDRLWDTRPPLATAADREAAAQAAARAAQNGWAPPMAWDDDRIDLPSAGPEPGWRPGQRATRRAADIAEDADFVRRYCGLQGATMREVSWRLGIERDNLQQATIRARRYAARQAGRRGPGGEPEAEAG